VDSPSAAASSPSSTPAPASAAKRANGVEDVDGCGEGGACGNGGWGGGLGGSGAGRVWGEREGEIVLWRGDGVVLGVPNVLDATLGFYLNPKS
jgi:hypothetical protein